MVLFSGLLFLVSLLLGSLMGVYNLVIGVVLFCLWLFHFYKCFLWELLVVDDQFYLNGFNGLLVFLTMKIFLVVYYSQSGQNYSHNKGMVLLCLVGSFFLVVCFMCFSMVGFYVFFELCMMPMGLLMGVYGMQPERLKAVMYMLIYTIFGSMPLLLGFVFFMNNLGSGKFYLLNMDSMDKVFWLLLKNYSDWWVMIIVIAFLLKLPAYGGHLWLPKAHVEAPVEGSVLLAGVLLKLGSYGLFVMMGGFSLNYKTWWFFMLSLYVVFIMFVSFICFRLKDFKVLVAYSSVVHMAMLLVCVCNGNYYSELGVMLMSVSHGFCSGGLFYCVKTFYSKTGTRNFLLKSGFMGYLGLSVFFWFMLCFSKCSLPPSLNLLSEMMCFFSLVVLDWFLLGFVLMSVFLSGVFCLFLYVTIIWGGWSSGKQKATASFSSKMLKIFLVVYGFALVFFMVILI